MAHLETTSLYTVPHGFHKGNGQTGQANGTGNGATQPVTLTINGHTVDINALALMSPSELARANAAAKKAEWPARARQTVIGGNPGLVSTAYRLTAWQQQLIDDGLATLSQFHNAKRRDRQIENFLRRPGVIARVLVMLDHMTAPASVPAE